MNDILFIKLKLTGKQYTFIKNWKFKDLNKLVDIVTVLYVNIYKV